MSQPNTNLPGLTNYERSELRRLVADAVNDTLQGELQAENEFRLFAINEQQCAWLKAYHAKRRNMLGALDQKLARGS